MTNKEAIDILWRYDVNFEPHPAEEVMHAIDMAIEALNAQPETHGKRTKTHACDYISRQAAIDALEKLSANYTGVGKREWHPHVRECQYEIQHMPPAQPERPKGHWIVIAEFKDCRYAKCNQCKVTQIFYYNKPLTNFCPNCGSDMRGKQDE